MSNPISRASAIRLIEEALADAETAIQAHPTETIEVYAEGAQAHRRGMEGAKETDWSREVGLSLTELNTIHRYLFAVSFMSAWWHLQGDKQRRNNAAQTASFLVGSAGINPEEALRHLIRYEQVWRKQLRSKGLVRSGAPGCASVLLAGIGALKMLVESTT